jgi:hypothetical protein
MNRGWAAEQGRRIDQAILYQKQDVTAMYYLFLLQICSILTLVSYSVSENRFVS